MFSECLGLQSVNLSNKGHEQTTTERLRGREGCVFKDDAFQPHVVSAESVFLVTVMGEGGELKREKGPTDPGFSPPTLDLLWKVRSPLVALPGRAEVLWAGPKVAESVSPTRGKAAWRGQLGKLKSRKGFTQTPSRAGLQRDGRSWPPSLRLGRSCGHGIKSKVVQETPGQSGKDPIGAGTQVQSQGLKPRVS